MKDAFGVRRIKGDIVEAICKNHFAAMGFQIENAGVEHFASQFANRSSRARSDAGRSNASKIQRYIGNLPDLLIGHESYDHHFVEAKFRTNISIDECAKELLWDYRETLFGRDFNKDLCGAITPMQWAAQTHAFDLPDHDRAHLAKFKDILMRGGIDASLIQVPVMFYVVIKENRKFSLFLIRFNDEDGCFQIHQAGKPKEIAAEDVATRDFLDRLDKSYGEVVAPVLRDVFSAEIDEMASPQPDATKIVPAGSILDICLRAALTLKVKPRHGVYFGKLLKHPPIAAWLQERKLPVNKENLRAELEKCGIDATPTTFELDGEKIDLSIRTYDAEFDFYMK
ncbi:hypothetical protein [Burkholderia pseudomultivorans]|uniref:hypothetical protein n=1 Tax=Burkholderia pseudomultivorans TaxID=1207504 RepID=UPI000759C82D|nr:hypothetical protein [Burkholderia pseudomultivorans]KVC31018.1 hypothetical protein WS55_07865 [Burkholderia pseudomultivorans]KVC31686.1 hypothetical protein WS56_16860 [Burkholderia pseudomultivorans]